MAKGSAKRLTPTGIQRLRYPSDGFKDHYDLVCPGLVLRVRPNKKSFYCRYREETSDPLQKRGRRESASKRKQPRVAQRFKLVGHYPETSLQAARETAERDEVSVKGMLGRNPSKASP